MWAIISTSKNLKFYDFDNKEFVQFVNFEFSTNELGYLTDEIEDDNLVVKRLRSLGIPVFMHKKDAKGVILKENKTGWKYLQLKPTVL